MYTTTYQVYSRDTCIGSFPSKAQAAQHVWGYARKQLDIAAEAKITDGYLSLRIESIDDDGACRLDWSGSFYPPRLDKRPHCWAVSQYCRLSGRAVDQQTFVTKAEAVRFARMRTRFNGTASCTLHKIGESSWRAEFKDGRVRDTNDKTLPFEPYYDETGNLIRS